MLLVVVFVVAVVVAGQRTVFPFGEGGFGDGDFRSLSPFVSSPLRDRPVSSLTLHFPT